MKKTNLTRIAYDALLSAMCVALGYYAIDLGTQKITLENLPILIGALMFGPVDGAAIAAVGIFLSQMLRYGLDASTVLWIIPYVVQGLFAGGWAKIRKFNMKPFEIVLLMILSGVVVTAVNTLSLIIYHKYIIGSPIQSVIVAIPRRILVSAGKSVAFAILVPLIIRGLEKAGIYRKSNYLR